VSRFGQAAQKGPPRLAQTKILSAEGTRAVKSTLSRKLKKQGPASAKEGHPLLGEGAGILMDQDRQIRNGESTGCDDSTVEAVPNCCFAIHVNQ